MSINEPKTSKNVVAVAESAPRLVVERRLLHSATHLGTVPWTPFLLVSGTRRQGAEESSKKMEAVKPSDPCVLHGFAA